MSLAERFWKKVNKTEGCWLWTGGTAGQSGYGSIRPGGKAGNVYAHRLSYEMAHGPIPHGQFVCHSCDTPACVNPSHLFLGTQRANVRDMMAKGRKVTTRGRACGPRVKLWEWDIKNIREQHAKGGLRFTDLARFYNVSDEQIRYVVNRRTWTHIDD